MNVIDSKFTVESVGLIFRQVNVHEKGELNPANSFVRFELLEALIRIGI